MEHDSLEARVASLETRMALLEARHQGHWQVLDTFILTPWWRRVLFALDGWSLHQVGKQQWRPWHRGRR